ncbi:hypothetical protein CDEST_00124 [Colletotrichum destructivum]|uniref:Uncharacterized protein n=1 Tax=Colletotrichum destructivum TaxID=34406 RepID=A0AAX4HVX6_9PEZI|nr:hypothetical protein CDEST_00124 [Colletotrichum destructivum]
MTAILNTSEIPSITILRQNIDYCDQTLPRCKKLHETMRYFRASFTSSKGMEGNSLIDWKSTKQQAALTEMTNAFLERDGMGRHFWPDDETSDRFNRLKYSTDHALIKQTIRQLFWRMNLQHFRNAKYRKNKDNKDSTAEDTLAGRGLSHDNPIEVDPVSDGDPSHNGDEIPESRRSVTVASFTAQHGTTDEGVPQLASNDTRPHGTGDREASKDPYRVPESPGIDGAVRTIREACPPPSCMVALANKR